MNTKLVSQQSLDIIDQYLNFKVGHAKCSVPYFNNKRGGQRAALRALVGKGNPKEILDEIEIKALQDKFSLSSFTDESLKKFMVDEGLGIDCSGLAYYILDAESRARDKGPIDRHLAFPNAHGPIGFIAVKLNPVKNADVLIFADEKNSRAVDLKDIEPGDFITMCGEETERNHIITFHQVDYQNFAPTALHYTHSIAWSEDGQYGHGVRQGIIEIVDPTKGILEQKWTEKEKTDQENPTFMRAKISRTEIRRLKWWM
ncbi:MAG: hypothetical protein P4L61_03920 [Candidatus Pacebacteria bacterium]|nr:hypothetical protein [Candidatus Paceibacterota bacterium]